MSPDVEASSRRTAPLTTQGAERLFEVDPNIRARRRELILVVLARALIVIAVLAMWQFASGRWVSSFWFSRPSSIAVALADFWRQGQLLPAIRLTLTEAAAGFLLGAVAGFLVGLLFGLNRLAARTLDPFLTALNSIPRLALIPLFILWFGIGYETKIYFAATLVFFPVFMNTFAGVADVDQDLLDVIKVMGASRPDAIRKVLIPSALVWVFAGLRVSVPFGLMGAVIAEIFSANQGLGYLISVSANQFDTAATFAAIFVVTLLGLLLTYAVGAIERRALRWRPAKR